MMKDNSQTYNFMSSVAYEKKCAFKYATSRQDYHRFVPKGQMYQLRYLVFLDLSSGIT